MTESQTKTPEIPILYRDEHLIVVHKPSGLLMHRSPISQDTVFLLQTLRDQIDQRVYPVHRLDRATSGVLLLGLNPDIASELVTQFESHQISKSYHALVLRLLKPSHLQDGANRSVSISNISRITSLAIPPMAMANITTIFENTMASFASCSRPSSLASLILFH
jgi:23S rRNA-/tRNA-specific pseudouridylate synthase